jgi:adenosylhomocysteinase
MYRLSSHKLRVCRQSLESDEFKKCFQNTRFILLQHLLTDTEEFINLMMNLEYNIHSVIAKPYSVDPSVKERLLKAYAFPIIQEPYATLEKKGVIDELVSDALEQCRRDDKKILIVDVGGYFLAPLSRLARADIKRIQGVVEVTKFGHNRYEENIHALPLPVFTIAESRIKTLEGRFVGLSAVAAVENILRDFGLSISGRRALVIGFGLIGKSVAAALRGRNLPVKVFDIRGFPKTEAFTLGYLVGSKKELLSRSDLILSSTANTSLSYEDLLQCKDGAVIGSVGSQQNEIDMKSLNERCIYKKQIHAHVTEYKLQNGKTLFLLKNGEAVNFLVQSCPDEVIDLIFAETIYCWKLLVNEEHEYVPGYIHRTPSHVTDMITESWLTLAGVDSY